MTYTAKVFVGLTAGVFLTALPSVASSYETSNAGPVKVAQATPAAQAATPKATQSLYERLGGIFAISAVVDRFSDAIIKNPKLNQKSPVSGLEPG